MPVSGVTYTKCTLLIDSVSISHLMYWTTCWRPGNAQVAAVLAEVDCPVMYFEQGHEYLFGDPIRFCPQHNYASTDRVFHKSMHLPMALAAVSNAARDILFHQARCSPQNHVSLHESCVRRFSDRCTHTHVHTATQVLTRLLMTLESGLDVLYQQTQGHVVTEPTRS